MRATCIQSSYRPWFFNDRFLTPRDAGDVNPFVKERTKKRAPQALSKRRFCHGTVSSVTRTVEITRVYDRYIFPLTLAKCLVDTGRSKFHSINKYLACRLTLKINSKYCHRNDIQS